jgi:hypothetical protein
MELKNHADNRNRTSVCTISSKNGSKPYKDMVYICWDLNSNSRQVFRGTAIYSVKGKNV